MISAVCADDPTHNINKHYIITTAVHQNFFKLSPSPLINLEITTVTVVSITNQMSCIQGVLKVEEERR